MKDEKSAVKNGKVLKRVLAGIVCAVLLVGAFLAGYFLRDVTNPEMASLRFIVETYKKYYLEESDDFVSIMGNSIVDRYSEYMTKEEYRAVVNGSAGRRSGIGISYDKTDLSITSVKGNSPAEKAGLIAGDVITGVKKSSATDFTNITDNETLVSFFGEMGDGELFSLRVNSSGKEKVCELAFGEYQEAYVFYKDSVGDYRFQDSDGKDMSFIKYGYGEGNPELKDDTAYIKYSSFNGRGNEKKIGSSAWQMKTALEKFKSDKKSKLILDLRGNGGGYMDILENIASHFIDVKNGSEKLISKAVYKDGKEDKFVSDPADFADYGFEKIVILANTGTASASEALIGAMLDYDVEGKISVVLSASLAVDEDNNASYVYRSYGKGIMQTTYVNPVWGDALKLTTAKIYWPVSGISIHGSGVAKTSCAAYADKIYEPAYEKSVDYELKKAISLLD